VCPQCKVPLEISNKTLYCPKHEEHYPVKDGIVEFFSRKGYMYSEIGGKKQRKLSRDVQKIKDIASLKALVYEKYKDIYRYIFSPARADFLYLLSKVVFSKENAFLDAGAGFGTVAKLVADRMQCSYALDATYSRIKFLSKWKQIENKKNIMPLFGNVFELPFKHSLDIVLLNGVLEWVGTFDTTKRVEEAQLEVLRECYTALKEDGVLIIAIENRYDPFFLYTRDHGGLFFTSYLPRKLANAYSQLTKNKPYRAYTYSYKGYNELLMKAGFRGLRIFGCFPVYRYPWVTFSLEDTKAVKFVTERVLPVHTRVRALKKYLLRTFFSMMSKRIFLARLLSPSFMIFAFKKGNQVDEQFIGDLAISGFGRSVKIFNIQKGVVTSVLREAKFRHLLSKMVSTQSLFKSSKRAPEIVSFNETLGYAVEKLVRGTNLGVVLKSDPSKGVDILSRVFKELLKFYQSQMPSFVPVGNYLKQISEKLRPYEKHKIIKAPIHELRFNIRNIINDKAFCQVTLPIVTVHGDLHERNILCQNVSDFYILDWENVLKANLFYDFFNFLSMHATYHNRYDFLLNILNRTKAKDSFENCILNIVDNICAEFQLKIDRLKSLYVIFLAERVIYHLTSAALTDVISEINRWDYIRNKVIGTL